MGTHTTRNSAGGPWVPLPAPAPPPRLLGRATAPALVTPASPAPALPRGMGTPSWQLQSGHLGFAASRALGKGASTRYPHAPRAPRRADITGPFLRRFTETVGLSPNHEPHQEPSLRPSYLRRRRTCHRRPGRTRWRRSTAPRSAPPCRTGRSPRCPGCRAHAWLRKSREAEGAARDVPSPAGATVPTSRSKGPAPRAGPSPAHVGPRGPGSPHKPREGLEAGGSQVQP